MSYRTITKAISAKIASDAFQKRAFWFLMPSYVVLQIAVLFLLLG